MKIIVDYMRDTPKGKIPSTDEFNGDYWTYTLDGNGKKNRLQIVKNDEVISEYPHVDVLSIHTGALDVEL